MLDLGWTELLVIGVVALIVVGPKDLPVLFRRVGQFVGKAKGMAREFSRAMNEAADESGVRDAASSFKSATNPLGSAMDDVKDATRRLADPLKDVDPQSHTGKLAAERVEKARKIQDATAKAAAERKKREAQEALSAAEAELAAHSNDESDAHDTDASPVVPSSPTAKDTA